MTNPLNRRRRRIPTRIGTVALYSGTLLLVFVWKILVANVRLAAGILRRRPVFVSAIFSYQTDHLKSGEAFVLANLLSLTPGTLTVDMDLKRRIIWVHTLYADEWAEIQADLDLFSKLIKLASGSDGAKDETDLGDQTWSR